MIVDETLSAVGVWSWEDTLILIVVILIVSAHLLFTLIIRQVFICQTTEDEDLTPEARQNILNQVEQADHLFDISQM